MSSPSALNSGAAPLPIPSHATFLGHPRPLFTLFFAEMWERFSFYGRRALLVVFMTLPIAQAGLGISAERAAIIYGTYTMSVYMMSIPGGAIADNLLGSRLSVLVGGIIIAAGHFSMAFPTEEMFFLGLFLVVIGTGLLKPNISAMVGQLYAEGDTRRDAGFSIFYMGINIGAFLAPFVTGTLAQHSAFKRLLAEWGFNPDHSWHWGFAAAGVGMLLGVIVFIVFGKGLREVGPPPARVPGAWRNTALTIGGTAALWAFVALSDRPGFTWLRSVYLLGPVALMLAYGYRKDLELRRLGAVFYFFIGALVFWAIYEQAGSSLTLFADRFTQETFLGIEFPSSWYQSASPAFVILLAILFSVLWTKLGNRQPSSPMKFTLGLFALGASFVVMIPAARLAAEGRVSPGWLLAMYFLQVVGEMCLSPVGLSTFTKLSPPRFVGLMLGVWFLAAAFGNKLAGVLASAFGEGDASNLDAFFSQQAIGVFVIAGIFLVLVPWVKRRMGGVL